MKIAQVAKDIQIYVGTLDERLREERVEQGQKAGVTPSDNAELRVICKRNKLLGLELEVLRRATAH